MMTMTADHASRQFDGILSNPIGRLEVLIDQETAALRSANAGELKDFNNRKAQVLMELDRALSTNHGQEPSPEMKAKLRDLREKLDTNSKLLKRHLDAVHEVVVMISDNLREADSDGTYTNGIRRGKEQP